MGDPLSLYLFVIGMEALSRFIFRVANGGFLNGCKVNGGLERAFKFHIYCLMTLVLPGLSVPVSLLELVAHVVRSHFRIENQS